MKFEEIPKVKLAFLPTPLQKVERLGKKIGVKELYIKRDDQTGLALGGNKARKLEYLMADALNMKADVVFTLGGPQSNHCRQTAAAARVCGLDSVLIFSGEEIEEVQGNMVLDRLLNSKWYFAGEKERKEKLQEVVEEYQKKGKNPYYIPLGGSNALGAMGYVEGGLETAKQCKAQGIDPDYIFIATGSGGTQAGLMMGIHMGGLKAKVIGISVSGSSDEITEKVNNLLVEMGAKLDVDIKGLPNVLVYDEFVGEGYGRPTELSKKALKMCAVEEGIIIDPVYTAKGLSGLIGMIEDNKIDKDSSVIFLHTGGMPALFAETDLYWKPDVDITR
ncbi:MAG: 1-aminocyclopropane-1-carboxylate deaminase/D-cysteine desulfhydrase [Clostridia bacterium]